MLNLLVSRCASGKTRFLQDLYLKSSEKSVFNMIPYEVYEDDYINETVLRTVDRVLELDNLNIGRDNKLEMYLGEEHSSAFITLLKYIVKTQDSLFLDDPEAGLTHRERLLMAEVLNAVGSIQNVWVATHSNDICLATNANYYNVKNDGSLEKIEYEDTDCI